MSGLKITLPRPVSGRELLAAVEVASTEGRYHSQETADRRFFAGQYNSDVSKSLLVSGAPTMCEESGLQLDSNYATVWLLGYMWALPYKLFDPRDIDEAPRTRFAARIKKALR